MSYGFNNKADLLKTVEELVKTQDPFTLRFSDKGHEFRSTGFSKYDFYLFVYLKGRNKPFDEEYKQAWEDINSAGKLGFPLDKAYFMNLQAKVGQ